MNRVKAENLYSHFARVLSEANSENEVLHSQEHVLSTAYELAVNIEDIWKDYK